jgi:hypothetical protein
MFTMAWTDTNNGKEGGQEPVYKQEQAYVDWQFRMEQVTKTEIQAMTSEGNSLVDYESSLNVQKDWESLEIFMSWPVITIRLNGKYRGVHFMRHSFMITGLKAAANSGFRY